MTQKYNIEIEKSFGLMLRVTYLSANNSIYLLSIAATYQHVDDQNQDILNSLLFKSSSYY